jgi:hypothetical protein
MPVWLCSPAESASQFFRCSFSFYRAVTFFDTLEEVGSYHLEADDREEHDYHSQAFGT